jgi:hypothetical protein
MSIYFDCGRIIGFWQKTAESFAKQQAANYTKYYPLFNTNTKTNTANPTPSI